MVRKILIGFLLLIAATAGAAWLLAPSPPKPRAYNVLWLTAESMRPQELHCYGRQLETSPNIDAFAKTGTLFSWCINPSGWTNESMISNLAGVSSPAHRVNTRDKHVPPEWYLPLEILRDGGVLVPRMQGFQDDLNHQYLGYTEAQANNLDPVTWLEQNGARPFFMWYHILETHLPYDAPEPHHSMFWKDDLVPNAASLARVTEVYREGVILRDSISFVPAEDLPGIRALYDADVHYMDANFGHIIHALDRLGLRENTIVIFSADHGEEQLERGNVGHASTMKGGTLHDEVIHVPLIISFPGHLPEARVVTTQVRGIDIMPTLFELLGLPAEDFFQGQSLLPVIEAGDAAKHRTAYASSSFKGWQEDDPSDVRDFIRVVRTPEWKLYYELWDGTEEKFYLYDLKDDPGELRDVKEAHPQQLHEMKQQLFSWLAACEQLEVRPEPAGDAFTALLYRVGLKRPVDLTGVPSPPPLLFPSDGDVLSYAKCGGEVVVTWEGREGVPYKLEASVGEGSYHFDLTIPVKGPAYKRSFSEAYWREYVHRYNPVRFRVKVDAPGHEYGPWRQIEIE